MRTRFLIASAFALSLAACGGSSPKPASPPPAAASGSAAAGDHGEMAEHCGMPAGTTAAVADTDGGVAITLTTTGDVAALREHVKQMAAMHEQMSAGSGAQEHMMMPPSHAAAEDVDGGARVTLTPTDPAQLDALRAAARKHVEMMKSGDCPMHHMGDHMDDH